MSKTANLSGYGNRHAHTPRRHPWPVAGGFGFASALSTAAFAQVDFDWPIEMADPDWGSYVAIGDFDRDGLNDLVVPKLGVGAEILRQNPDGSFSSYSEVGTPTSESGFLILATDIDTDGDLDLIWVTWDYSEPTTLYLAINDDAYGTQWRTSSVEMLNPIRAFNKRPIDVGELDRDGDLEIICASEHAISKYDTTDGELQQGVIIYDDLPGADEPNDIVTGDFDGDGDLDFAALIVNGYYYSPPPYSYVYYKVDSSKIIVFKNDGDGRFSDMAEFPLPYDDDIEMGPREIVAGDMDGDHDLDLVLLVGSTNSAKRGIPAEIRLIENTAVGQDFQVRNPIPFGHGDAWTVALGDVNTDGSLDVVAGTEEDRAVYVFVNDRTGGFEDPVAFPTGYNDPSFIGCRDINDDGRLDLVVFSAEYRLEGLLRLANLTDISHLPGIAAPPLHPGQFAEVLVHGLRPNESATIASTVDGWKPTLGFAQYGQLTFDLAMPIAATRRFRADENGSAVLRFYVARHAQPGQVLFQVAVRRGPDGRYSVKSPLEATAVFE